MGAGVHTLLVVHRSDGSIVATEAFERAAPATSGSSPAAGVPMDPPTVHVVLRRSHEWRPVRRPPGLRRLGRHRRAPQGGRMLALPVAALLLLSTSAVAFPGSPDEVAAAPPIVAAAVERAQPPPSVVTSPSAARVEPSLTTIAAAGLVVVDPTAPGYTPPVPVPATVEECRDAAREMPLEIDGVSRTNLLARMIHETFECVGLVGGLGARSPTATARWDAADAWGFDSLAEQVAAEAVVVAYCESLGFRRSALRRNNPWGYGGVFQMGTAEMRRFGPDDGDKFDAVDNTVAAASYFLWGFERGAGWDGWGPWAVVNTDYDDPVNDRVAVPVLPRFASTDAGHRGRTGPELPAWAVDPWSWTVPEWRGCPAMFGWTWPETDRLGG